MATRWRLDRMHDVLDVGAGIGHWGQLLAELLPEDAAITGVDRDPHCVELAVARARRRSAAQTAQRFEYRVALAERLPFADDSFDLVTCQTVLIHARDPVVTLAEMIRVTRPGGLVAVAEPNNAAGALLGDVAAFYAPVEELLAIVRFTLRCERGKTALGEGDNSVGERLPGLFAAAGLTNVDVFLSDRTSAMFPPYSSPAQRAIAEETTSFAARDFWIWSREDTLRYFVAGGGTIDEFEPAWDAAIADRRRAAAAIADGMFDTAGGAICYLVSGCKPE